MKHCCRNCHFMASGLNQSGTSPTTLSKKQRERIKPQTGSVWGCNRRVWNTSFLSQNDNSGAAEIEPFTDQMLKDRRESCFFVEHQEGMEWQAANDLQRLEYENRNLKKSYRYTLWGLIIAGIGLVISAIFQGANFFAR